jgi:deoxyribonuclease V
VVAAVFCAFPTGLHGPGVAGDRAWAAAVLWAADRPAGDAVAFANEPFGQAEPAAGLRSRIAQTRAAVAGRLLAEGVAYGSAGAGYEAGLLALRAGPVMEAAVRLAIADGVVVSARPDVLLVDATGLDHPRGAGLALHLGANLGVPSVGVTNRVLEATFAAPEAAAGSVSPLMLRGRRVGFALRSRAGANPVLVHAAWRTDPETALAVVQPLVGRWRTPEPLRLARHAARATRARSEGRAPASS